MFKIIEETKIHAHPNTKYHCLRGFYELGYTKSQLAVIYGKAPTTITNWIDNFEKHGTTERCKPDNKKYAKFDEQKRNWLVQLYMNNPVLFIREAAYLFKEQFKVDISQRHVLNILNEAGLTRKTLERRAIQISLQDILRYEKELQHINWMLHNLVFLDEVSFNNTDMWRTHGYGIKGKSLFYRGEFCRKARVSLLCYCNVFGMIDCQMTEGTFTRKTFSECLRRFIFNPSNLVRQYPGPNSIFILDGARIHTDENITSYLRSLGLFVLYLPSYSPFYNPIEVLFGLMKREFKARYVENKKIDHKILIGQIVNDFRNKNMKGIFKKCGYVENGIFNASKGMGQDLKMMGFKNQYGN